MILKTIDRLILKSFIGPYIFSFFVAEFVLVMQFLWKYIDELVGKGLSFWFLVELVFYYAVTIIPLAVPITILISSVMVYGDLAEKYEISSFKSAGVSLLRIMRPGIILAVFTFSFSLLASNYLKPKANLKFYQAFENVRKQKPSMTIEEKTFNDDFRGFTIRVGKKLSDGEGIEEVMIFDNSNRSFLNLTTAKTGKMYTIKKGKYFVMELEDVEQYREMQNKNKKNRNASTAFLRSEFKSWTKIFDMSEFEFSERTSGLARRKYDLYNSWQLVNGIDSINTSLVKVRFRGMYDFTGMPFVTIDSTELLSIKENEVVFELEKSDLERLAEEANEDRVKPPEERSTRDSVTSEKVTKPDVKRNLKKLGSKIETLRTDQIPIVKKAQQKPKVEEYLIDSISIDSVKSLAELIPSSSASSVMFRALNIAQTIEERIKASVNEARIKGFEKRRYVLRLHQIYSWALVCIIFMFIGAPLGSIVRKGGYGYPLLIAIVFFMVFIIMMIMGEKLNKSETISAELAAWLPCVVLFPISALLSYWALGDIGGINFTWLQDIIAKFRKKK